MKNPALASFLSILLCSSLKISAQVTGWNNGGGNFQKNGFVNVNTPMSDSILWQINSPGANGTPLFIEGNYLVTMRFFTPNLSPVECYDLNTGNLIWSIDVTNGGGRSLPVGLRDEKVYIVGYTDTFNDTLYALDVNTGSQLWIANVTVGPYISETAVFDSIGNLYIGGSLKTYKINPMNGQLIWQTTTVPMASGSAEMVINTATNTGYTLEQSGGISFLWAIDLSTGLKKYTHVVNDLQPGGNVPQSAIMVGTNGIIYAQLTEDNVAALRDDGTQLSLLWQEEIFGNSAFSLMCSGPDGSVYAPSGGRIIRFDGITGDTLNLSASITQGGFFTPRISASGNGMIYVTNGENFLYAFDSTLNLVWSDLVPFNNTSGACIAPSGLVAVAGQNIIKVYSPALPTSIQENESARIRIFPNPTTRFVVVDGDDNLIPSPYTITDMGGRFIKQGVLLNRSSEIGLEELEEGCYLLRIEKTRQNLKFIKN